MRSSLSSTREHYCSSNSSFSSSSSSYALTVKDTMTMLESYDDHLSSGTNYKVAAAAKIAALQIFHNVA